jgi:hypothetical protein
MNKKNLILLGCSLILCLYIVSCSSHQCQNGYVKVTLVDGRKVCVPKKIAKGKSKDQPIGSLYFHEEVGILELTKYGWTNFHNETVLPIYADDE